MLKMKKKFAVSMFLCASLLLTAVVSVPAAAKSVQFWQSYHQNIYTGSKSNFYSAYESVPSHYKVKNTTHTSYTGGWNYKIHEIYYNWTANGK